MKLLKRLVYTLVAAFLLFSPSCSDDKGAMELDWIKESTRTVLIDTCTIELFTVNVYDSVKTNEMSAYVGKYADKNIGSVASTTFVPFNPALDFSLLESDAFHIVYRLDSLTLNLKSNKYYRGDTLQPMKLNVYKLEEEIGIANDSLYNTTEFRYNPEPVATHTFLPKPVSEQEISIRLPDEWGADMLKKLVAKNDTLREVKPFQRYFNGLVVTGETEDKDLLMGFRKDTSFLMTMYYKEIGALPNEMAVHFYADTIHQFNNIEFDRSGTPFSNMKKKDEMNSKDAGNLAFSQGISTMYTKLTFPYLREILKLGDYGYVVNAELLVYPIRNSWSEVAPLPKNLDMFMSDQNNNTTDAITGGQDTTNGELIEDPLFPENTHYRFDVTKFVKDQYMAFGYEKENLQIVIPDYKDSFNVVVFGDQKYPQADNIKLRITYSIYDEK